MRYVERNPLQAGLVSRAEEYPWSSAGAHVWAVEDPVLTASFLTEQIPDWVAFLQADQDDPVGKGLERYASTGRPLGGQAFVEQLEVRTGRVLRRRRPGPTPAMAEAR